MFNVIEIGLIVPGMPYSHVIKSYKSLSRADAFADGYRVSAKPIAGMACAAIIAAFRVIVVPA